MSRDPCFNKDTWPPFGLVMIIFVLLSLFGLFTCAKFVNYVKLLEYRVGQLEGDVRRLKQ